MFSSTLIQFVIFILPGYVSLSIFRWKYPVRLREDNHEIIWGAVYGLFQFILLYKLFPDKFNIVIKDSESLISIHNTDVVILLLASGFIFGIISVLLTLFRDKIFYESKRLRKFRRSPDNIWLKINREHEFKNSWIVVFLDDGAIYKGYVKFYQYNPNLNEQDFLLGRATRVDDNLGKKYDITGAGVYLSTSNVKRIELL